MAADTAEGVVPGVPVESGGLPLGLDSWDPVHWRLREALASQSSFTSLWTALSEGAAVCFEEGGHRRSALQCHADVADSLAARGMMAEAAAKYESQCRAALREGWLAVATKTLPKLVACQLDAGLPGLPHSAVALLFLLLKSKNNITVDGEREVEGGSRTPPALLSALDLVKGASLAPSVLLSTLPPLLRHGMVYGNMDLSPFLTVSVVRNWYYKFYGRSTPDGKPVLTPTGVVNNEDQQEDVDAVQRRMQAAVGDVAPVVLQLTNPLPAAVELRDMRLILAGMQPMSTGEPNEQHS